MWKFERPSKTLAFKEDEGVATKSNCKGHLLTPTSSSSVPRRCSKRLLDLEARRLQTSIPVFTSPSIEDSPTTEIATATSQVVTQETRLASLSSDQDIPIIKEAAKDTQEPLRPKATFLAYSRQKFTCTHGMISPPREAKRGKFLEENKNNENGTLEDNFGLGDIQKTQVDANVVVALPITTPAEVFENDHGSVIGLTEMANVAEKHLHEDSEDEIVSCASHAIYGVKTEFNSLIEKIFEKHGDIAENHSLHSNMLCSFFLETVCNILKKLQESTFQKIKKEELDFMLHQLVPIEAKGIRVEWLRKKLDDIKEAKTLLLSSSKIKEKREIVKAELGKFVKEVLRDESLLMEKVNELKTFEGQTEEFQRKIKELQGNILKVQGEMAPMKEKLSFSRKRLAELKVESKEIDASAHDTMKKVQSVFRRPLVDGLL